MKNKMIFFADKAKKYIGGNNIGVVPMSGFFRTEINPKDWDSETTFYPIFRNNAPEEKPKTKPKRKAPTAAQKARYAATRKAKRAAKKKLLSNG